MEEIRAFVSQHGWKCNVTSRDDIVQSDGRATPANISISFVRNGERPTHDHQTPSYSVSCNKREDSADFYGSTIGQGHGGSGSGDGSMKMDTFTTEAIHDRLVKFITKLLEDAKPYSRR
jgi:hypothetical protein